MMSGGLLTDYYHDIQQDAPLTSWIVADTQCRAVPLRLSDNNRQQLQSPPQVDHLGSSLLASTALFL